MISWSDAPSSSQWFPGMVVADIELSKDETLTMYADKNSTGAVQEYWVVRDIKTKKIAGPSGVSMAPHLYLTKGKAAASAKRYWKPSDYEVVPVTIVVPA